MNRQEVPDGTQLNDLLGLSITALRNFAGTVPGAVPPILNDHDLLACAAEAGELGYPWDSWLYEAHPGWRNNEADRTARENASTIAAFMEDLLVRDAQHGPEQHFPLPQFFLNIAGHSWSIYDSYSTHGQPLLHDDGLAHGIHALTKTWAAYLPPENRSWWTDHFAEESARLVNASRAQRTTSGTAIRQAEWAQHARGQLVTVVYLADQRQQHGWKDFVHDLALPDQDSQATIPVPSEANVLPAHVFAEGEFPSLAGMAVRLVTLPLSPAVTNATRKKTLQIYVIEPVGTSAP